MAAFARRRTQLVALLAAAVATRIFMPTWCGWQAMAWYQGDRHTQQALAEHLVAFEAHDDRHRRRSSKNRFAGEWALVTHQMTALGLAQVALAHPELLENYRPVIANAARKSFLPEMRDFGTRAWHGQDAMRALASSHGHAYLAYSALAISVARWIKADLPKRVIRKHDALIAAYARRLSRSRTGLIETYPGEAYPTDVAAVAAAIAVHGRATGKRYDRLLKRWAAAVRKYQIHPSSGLVYQRMGARNAKAHDAPRGSGTALAAYFAGFADRELAEQLSRGVFRHERSLFGFGAIAEYADGFSGSGDVDSGPVILGVSVSATGFALANARATGRPDSFERIFRTVELFGVPTSWAGRKRYTIGGPIGNALLLALLTSGPELAP